MKMLITAVRKILHVEPSFLRIDVWTKIDVEALKMVVERYFIFAFAFVFYTSWAYEITALGVETAWLKNAKNIIILGFMSLMIVGIRWAKVKFNIFSIACALWLVFNLVFWFYYLGQDGAYARRIGGGVFAFCLLRILFRIHT